MPHQPFSWDPAQRPPSEPLPPSTLAMRALRGELTVQDLDRRFERFCDYATDVLGHSPATVSGYRDAYKRYRRFLGEDLEAPRRIAEIESWIASLRRRGLSHVTVNTYWRSLRTFFNDLEKRDGFPNPFRGMRPPPLPSRVPKAFPPADCQRILVAAANIPWRTEFERTRAVAVIAIILYAGLRRQEVVQLKFVDVDFDLGVIRVWRGKGRAGGKDRTVYMNPDLKEYLARFLRHRSHRRIEGAAFFAGTKRGYGFSVSTLRRIHARVRRASGIPFSLHALRHSFVTELLRAGVPIHVARELAGHTNISTTAGYLRVWDEDLRTQIKKLSYDR